MINCYNKSNHIKLVHPYKGDNHLPTLIKSVARFDFRKTFLPTHLWNTWINGKVVLSRIIIIKSVF